MDQPVQKYIDIPENYDELRQQYQVLLSRFQEVLLALEIAESAKMAKSTLIANISHDLRTPLHAILSYSRFGIDKITRIDTEKIIKYFKNIEESGKKLQEMLNQIVDLSKLESGKMVFQMHSSNLLPMVQSMLSENKALLDSKQIKAKVETSGQVGTVICDQNKMIQVMSVLLSNAVWYAPEESNVTISIRNKDTQTVGISFHDHREEPLPRIATENIEAFIEQEMIKPGIGTRGIGLAIANEIVKIHKGSLMAENKDTGGSAVWITLPLEVENSQ